MLRSSLVMSALLALPLVSGCSPEPCTSCLDVSGTFMETTTASTVDCQAWRFLILHAGEGQVRLTQLGSQLTLSGGDEMRGVLHSDNSASFGPTNMTFRPVDGAGQPDPNGHPIPGLVSLHGWFRESKGKGTSFQGTYVFISNDAVKCEVTSEATWSR
jgi:hypothetical protein